MSPICVFIIVLVIAASGKPISRRQSFTIKAEGDTWRAGDVGRAEIDGGENALAGLDAQVSQRGVIQDRVAAIDAVLRDASNGHDFDVAEATPSGEGVQKGIAATHAKFRDASYDHDYDDDADYDLQHQPSEDYSYSNNQRMSPDDALVMYRMGHIVGKLFDKHDIVHWATDGSLIGALRNKGIIPHDDDIDFCVLAPQLALLKSDDFQKELNKNGLHLQAGQDWRKDNLPTGRAALLPREFSDRLYIWNHSEFNRTKGNMNERGTKMKLDLWLLENSKGKWHQPIFSKYFYPGSLCEVEDGKHKCKLERHPFGLGEVWIPSLNISKEYLTRRYGDWASAPKCEGMIHSCHLIGNLTHDLHSYAEPAGPLIDPASV